MYINFIIYTELIKILLILVEKILVLLFCVLRFENEGEVEFFPRRHEIRVSFLHIEIEV